MARQLGLEKKICPVTNPVNSLKVEEFCEQENDQARLILALRNQELIKSGFAYDNKRTALLASKSFLLRKIKSHKRYSIG